MKMFAQNNKFKFELNQQSASPKKKKPEVMDLIPSYKDFHHQENLSAPVKDKKVIQQIEAKWPIEPIVPEQKMKKINKSQIKIQDPYEMYYLSTIAEGS